MQQDTRFREIDEDLLKKASILSTPNNSFDKALKLGEEYRAAGLTPIYFADDDDKILHVTTHEKIYYGFN
jgi:hypothetical protein